MQGAYKEEGQCKEPMKRLDRGLRRHGAKKGPKKRYRLPAMRTRGRDVTLVASHIFAVAIASAPPRSPPGAPAGAGRARGRVEAASWGSPQAAARAALSCTSVRAAIHASLAARERCVGAVGLYIKFG